MDKSKTTHVPCFLSLVAASFLTFSTSINIWLFAWKNTAHFSFVSPEKIFKNLNVWQIKQLQYNKYEILFYVVLMRAANNKSLSLSLNGSAGQSQIILAVLLFVLW